ncbi:SpoIIE family protein phosphatase [Asanoa sp. NPDC050611]|uniref:PP2C family protein-serine/threonine phosphatase n=1 Tax=Asanoa sp. NPDC050611 TaxID=3157098 RepID=UPI0033DA909B
MTGADDSEELYDNAPCGSLSTSLDGAITKVNATLLRWLGLPREQVVGRRFSDLLTVGGRIYYETHMAPLLRMQGEIGGVALELKAAGDNRMPVLVTATVITGRDETPQYVRTIVFDARDRLAYEQELLRARQAADRDRERLRQLVRSLQQSLLPAVLPTPPGTQTAAAYHMASPDEVGGDFYDLFPLPDGRWGFLLGDVCGKGVGAAAVTAMARYTLRTALFHDPDPATALDSLNAILYQDHRSVTHRHCTVVCGTLTTGGEATIVIATGGHPPPLLLQADGDARYLPANGGPLIGVLADATYRTQTLTLNPGDTLLLYTDGLVDAHLPDAKERYELEALLAFAGRLAPASAASTVEAITALLASFEDGLDDDAAVMAIGATSR